MTAYEQMSESEQRKLNFKYAETLRFVNMREVGSYYLPEDMPSLDSLKDGLVAMDALYELPTL